MGIRNPDVSGFWMVFRFQMVGHFGSDFKGSGPFKIQTMASLGRFIYNKKIFIKQPRQKMSGFPMVRTIATAMLWSLPFKNLTIQNPTPKMSGFHMILDFEWSDFGSSLYFTIYTEKTRSWKFVVPYSSTVGNWIMNKWKHLINDFLLVQYSDDRYSNDSPGFQLPFG